MTFRDIAYQAQRDMLNLRPAQVSSTDVYADLFKIMNRMIDEWAFERFFVYVGTPGAYTILAAFPDQITDYTFAPGYVSFLEKALAVGAFPAMKIYGKFDSPEMKQLETEVVQLRRALEGVGVV